MERWVRQPLVQLQDIQQRQDCVTALLGLGKDQIREALRNFTGIDLYHLAMTLGLYGPSQRTKKSTMQDDDDNNDDMAEASKSALLTYGDSKKALQALYQVYLLASSKLPQLLEATQLGNDDSASASGGTLPTLLHQAHHGLKKMCSELDRCQGLVEAVLDLDAAPRDFLVKPDFKEELQDLHVELRQVQSQVQDESERMQDIWAETSGSSSQQIRLEQDASDSNWQFRLPNTNDSKTLQQLGNKIQIHRMLKNGVYFSTMELRQLSSKYRELTNEYQHHSRQVIQDAMSVATTYQTVVERACDVVATLDALCAMAHVAAYSPHGYCKPKMTDSDEDGIGIQVKKVSAFASLHLF